MPPYQHISERDLVSGLRARDKNALSYLYDHYAPALFGVISRILKNEKIAEEVLNDVFVRIWERFDNYDPAKGKLFTWMLNIARNQAIDKTRSREISKESKTGGIDNIVSKIDTQEFVEQSTDTIGMKEVLNHLPDDQKFVVEYLYFKGYSQSELAEKFGIPLGTVKTRLRLALQQLRMILGVK